MEIMTVSTKGQITIPADIRQKFNISCGDKLFGEERADGFIIRRPNKGLLDYNGFIKTKHDPEAETETTKAAVSAHVMGDDGC